MGFPQIQQVLGEFLTVAMVHLPIEIPRTKILARTEQISSVKSSSCSVLFSAA
jgi:hypothetical protein